MDLFLSDRQAGEILIEMWWSAVNDWNYPISIFKVVWFPEDYIINTVIHLLERSLALRLGSIPIVSVSQCQCSVEPQGIDYPPSIHHHTHTVQQAPSQLLEPKQYNYDVLRTFNYNNPTKWMHPHAFCLYETEILIQCNYARRSIIMHLAPRIKQI